MYYDRAALKRTAKAIARDSAPKAWKVAVLFMVVTSVVPSILTGIVPGPSVVLTQSILQDPTGFRNDPMSVLGALQGSGMVIGTFLSVLAALFTTVMRYGACGYCVKAYRRQGAGYRDLFSAFPWSGRVIVSALLVTLFTFLWCIPMTVLAALALVGVAALAGESVPVMVAAVVVVYIFAFVAAIWITYRYALVPYFIMDDPDTGAMDAIRASKKAMQGNKRKRFVLGLSFVGWHLLLLLIPLMILLIGGGAIVAANIAAFGVDLLENPAVLFSAGVPLLLVLGVALLAALPLEVWLWGYENITFAGFYDAVTGRAYRPPQEPPVPPEQPYDRTETPASYPSPRSWENRYVPPAKLQLPEAPAEEPEAPEDTQNPEE